MIAALFLAALLQGDSSSVVSVSAEVVDAGPLQPGATFTAALSVGIQGGWHINSHEPLDELLVATVWDPGAAPGIAFDAVAYPHAEVLDLGVLGEMSIWEDEAILRVTGHVAQDAVPGTRVVAGTLQVQACDDSVCLRPARGRRAVKVSMEVVVAGDGAAMITAPDPGLDPVRGPGERAVPSPSEAARLKWGVIGPPVLVFLGPDGTEVRRYPEKVGADEILEALEAARAGEAAETGESRERTGLVLLLAAFIGGLLINLTPCVYPIIGVTVGYFANQKKGGWALPGFYALGIVITFTALFVGAAAGGAMFGALLQSRAVNLAFAALMVILAASSFGAFTIQAPTGLLDKVGGARTGALGAMAMGLTMGITAAPCAGPFILALLPEVFRAGDMATGIKTGLSLSVGLALPYLFLGFFSGRAGAMPKPGGWMEWVKHLLGCAILLVAIWFFQVAVPHNFMISLGVGLTAVGIFLGLMSPHGRDGGMRVVRVVALVAFAGLGPHVIRQGMREGLPFEPYTEEALAAARAEGRPVFIDFTASWCIPCKVMEHGAFKDPAVVAAAQGFVCLQVDLTEDDDS